MEVKGRITVVNATQQINDTFQKRELVLQTVEDWPQVYKIEFIQDNCKKLDGYNVGDMVTVGINLRGREYTKQNGETGYFTSLQGWRIEKENSGFENNLQHKAQNSTEQSILEAGKDDDLPF